MGATVVLEIQVEDITVIAHIPTGVSEKSQFDTGKKVYILITRSHVFSVRPQTY